jgi:hypothetical protein
MGQLVSEIILNLGGNLAAKASMYGNSMTEFARKNQTALGIAGRSIESVSRGLDKIGNRYTAIGAGIITGATMRNVADYEASLVRLGTNAQLSDEQIAGLNKRIKEVSNQKDIRINSTELLSAVDQLISLTGDVDFVNNNIENIGYTMQAFGSDAKSSAELLAQFWEKNVRGADDVNKSLDELYGQFAVGKVSVEDIARVSPKLFSIIQQQGPGAIAQMGGLLQVFAKTKGSADEAVTSINAVFADLMNKKNIQFLSKQGVDVFKKGTKEFKEPVELLNEILKKAKYDPVKLGDVFSQTSMEGLKSLLNPANRKLLEQLVSGDFKVGATNESSAKNAETYKAAMSALNNEWSQFADKELAEPIKELADAINSVDHQTVQDWLELGKNVALVVAGAVALNKGVQIGRDVKDLYGFIRGKKGGAASGAGAGSYGIGGSTPVYVVNMPSGGFQGGLSDQGQDSTPDAVDGMGRKIDAAIKVAGVYSMAEWAGKKLVNDTGFRDAARNTDIGRYIDDRGIPGMSSDLWDLLKSSAAESQRFAQQQQAELYGNLNIRVSDDRVSVSKSGFSYPSLNVNIDNGRSMTGGD